MTNEEACEKFKEQIKFLDYYAGDCDEIVKQKDAYNKAISALEKQIPKGLKIQTEVYPENSTYICPNCGRLFGYVKYGTEGIESAEINYCPGCGQAIKWESEGEHEQ